MSKPLYIVVVGCGRLGSRLANALSGHGHAVVVVDRDEARFASLSSEFSGFRVEGDATHVAVLTQAGLAKADALIAATHEDNVNLLVAQVASKVFGVPRALARVYDPRRDAIAAQLGIDTVCTTTLALQLLLDKVLAGDARRPEATP